VTGPSFPDAREPGAEEELVQTRRSRVGPLLAVLLAAAAVVALVVHVSRDSRPAARPAPTSTAPFSPAPRPPAPQPTAQRAGALVELYCPAAGDGGTVCATRRTVPAAFLAAVRHLLPGVVTRQAVSATLRATDPQTPAGIYMRLFQGRAGRAVITVVVQQADDVMTLPFVPSAERGQAVVWRQHRAGRYVVAVQVEAPLAAAPSAATVDTLARDPRLVAA
jgi:hypothetical protein